MFPIGTAGAPKICPLYRISLRSRVTISRVDCTFIYSILIFKLCFFYSVYYLIGNIACGTSMIKVILVSLDSLFLIIQANIFKNG